MQLPRQLDQELARELGQVANHVIRARLEQMKAEKNVRQFVSDLMAQAKVNHAAAIAPSRSPS